MLIQLGHGIQGENILLILWSSVIFSRLGYRDIHNVLFETSYGWKFHSGPKMLYENVVSVMWKTTMQEF